MIDGLQFVVDHKDALQHPRRQPVAATRPSPSPTTDPLDAAVEQAWFTGIVVVTAAGNRGADADAVGYAPATIRT